MFWSVIVALTVISGTKFLDLDNDECCNKFLNC